MNNDKLIDFLSGYDISKVRVLFHEEYKRTIPLGFMRQYKLIESRGILLIAFSSNSHHSLFDIMFSDYLIWDAKVADVSPDFIVVDGECRERIMITRTGILERLKISTPLIERIERIELNSYLQIFNVFQTPEGIFNDDNQAIVNNSWQNVDLAVASDDCKLAFDAFQSISKAYNTESVAIKQTDPDKAKSLSEASIFIGLLAVQVKRKKVSISIARSWVLGTPEKSRLN
jgi:hypothetical protein